MQAYIYCLLDPRTENVRYVGVTKNKESRLRQHISSINRHRHHCSNWIRSLINIGLKPIMDIIDEVDENNWQEKERYWIKSYRDIGCDLTNSVDGGFGVLNPSIESRNKMSLAHIGIHRSEESVKKTAGGNRGQKRTKETCEKISKALIGKKLSIEHRKKIGLAKIGNKNLLGYKHAPESLAKMSLCHKGRPAWNKGISPSHETRRKISQNNARGMLGRHHSEETKRKISESEKISKGGAKLTSASFPQPQA